MKIIKSRFGDKHRSGISMVCGVGVNDSPYMISAIVKNKKVYCPIYSRWNGMINRCYNQKIYARRPSYKDCTVCDEWLTFSNFKEWMKKQDWQGKQLDKDLLVVGNKVYGPNTCIFITSQVNSLLSDCSASRGDLPLGVCLVKKTMRYRSSSHYKGEQVELGCYETANEASYAYKYFKVNLILEVASNQSEPLRSALIRHSKRIQET